MTISKTLKPNNQNQLQLRHSQTTHRQNVHTKLNAIFSKTLTPVLYHNIKSNFVQLTIIEWCFSFRSILTSKTSLLSIIHNSNTNKQKKQHLYITAHGS